MGTNRAASVLHEVEPGGHVVHFYADEDALAASVTEYALAGLVRGEGVVLIAEPEHLETVRRALVAGRARAGSGRGARAGSGRDESAGSGGGAGPEPDIRLLDADDVLDRVMVDGRPVPELFAEVVGGALQSTLVGRAGVRAYGEMVDKLWRDGNVTGALAVEELWNELAHELPFTLYCAYRDILVAGDTNEAETAVDATCRLHSTVVGDGALARRTSACRRFAADDSAPAAARAFVLAALRAHGTPLADTAALVVSELATNAVRHGRTGFTVTVSALARRVRIAVGDGRPEFPVLRECSETAPGGRGLRIVDALSREWGTTRRFEGKVVWAELDR